MKKSLSYVLLGVMAFSALAGCNKKGNGGEASGSQAPASESVAPSGDSGSSSVAPAKSDWTDDEKALMSRLLYGQVLPFFEKEGAVVSAEKDSSDHETGKLLIEGGTATATSMTAYAAKFTAAGYSVSDISASVGLESGRAFRAEKSVQVESATKYIRAEFCPVSSATGSPASAGVLSLVAADPYDYAWPAEDLAKDLKSAFGTEVVIPDPEAPRYEFSEDANGFYCTAFSAPEGYAAKLTAFSVAGEAGADGFYKADPSDGLFEAYFKYADGNLYLKVTPLHSWPGASIAGFFAKHSLQPFLFPQMTVEGSTYQFMEMPDQGEGPYFVVLIAGGTEAALSTYISSLDTDTFKITPSQGNYYIEFTVPDKGVANVMYRYMQGYGVACYVWGELGALPVADFPAAAVATQLGELVTTDSVVPFSGCNSYQENEGFILCTCSDTSAYAGLISAYETALNTAGWTANGVQTINSTISATHYSSPNHQIDIYFFEYGGSVRFYFRATVFDVTEARKLADKVAGAATTDAIIGPAGVNAYNYNSDSFGEYLFCPAYADTATKLSTYVSALTAAGYEEVGEDSDGKIYNSPNNQFAVKPYIYNSVVIEVDFLAPVVIAATWPSEAVANLTASVKGSACADVIPAIDGANSYVVDGEAGTITMVFADADALAGAVETFVAALGTSNFALDYVGLFGSKDGYSSEHREFAIQYEAINETFTLTVYITNAPATSTSDWGTYWDCAATPVTNLSGAVKNCGFYRIARDTETYQAQGYVAVHHQYLIVLDPEADALAKITEIKGLLDGEGSGWTEMTEYSTASHLMYGDSYYDYLEVYQVSANVLLLDIWWLASAS